VILKYSYKGQIEKDPWEFTTDTFDRINLFVGISGSGKSRFLNLLFNMARSVSKSLPFSHGKWEIEFLIDDVQYRWELNVNNKEEPQPFIEHEKLTLTSNEDVVILIDRNRESFLFKGTKLPKLPRNKPGIALLNEEESILPIYNHFTHIQRRLFYESGLRDAMSYEAVPLHIIENIRKEKNIELIWKQELTVNTKMFLMKELYPELYDIAINNFINIFPFIKQCDVKATRARGVPIAPDSLMVTFCIKEKGIQNWLNLADLSSGMQKVLLIITDILLLPRNSTYIIDEYENSLGINAIDFLPDFLITYARKESQFFITTHHPYLINSMPIEYWRIFHREGSSVVVKNGSELKERYGKSKQKAFVQLINDPLYTGNEL